ncbi:MAG: leucine-rich repeat domain-containing protein [Oscillospiraceae bacterium]|nr:leucine-rich repeat domain-containing protein [Oscillospiraceae bacterium]
MKKSTALAIALVIALSLSACGGKEDGSAAVVDVTTSAAETVRGKTEKTEMEKEETEVHEETTMEETAAEETTAEEIETEDATEPAEPEYQIPDWDSLEYADELDFITEDVDGGVAITEYLGTNPIVKIPEIIDGKKVVQIGTAYLDKRGEIKNYDKSPFIKSDITDVKLPNGVTKVDMCAFWGCNSLKSVSVPDSVTVIEQIAFAYCYDLESVNIPKGVTRIGNAAFRNCTNLKNITIPDSVTKISNWAFCECSSLKSIDIPKTVKNIGFGAFSDCSSITELIYPENVILDNGDYEWTENYIPIFGMGCSNLKSIDIPKGVTYIGYDGNVNATAFGGCTSLETVTFPDTVTEMDITLFITAQALKV